MNPFDLDDDELGLTADELRQQLEEYERAMAERPPAPEWCDDDVDALAGREEVPPW